VNPATFNGGRSPVETFSWIEAVTFCNKQSLHFEKRPCYSFDLKTRGITFNANANGFRLPTEAQWRYSCQAGGRNNRYAALNDVASHKDSANNRPQEVVLKQPNKWGSMAC
jgi:formylglycine-generating enzyme required for sulfatase activity